jgi:hypothetical protein
MGAGTWVRAGGGGRNGRGGDDTWVLYQVRCETQRLAEALAICRLLESGSKAEPVSMCGRMLVPSLMPLWMNQISVTCARKP